MTLISKEDFLRSQNDREIVRKTAGQILKDFARFGIELEFPSDLAMAYVDLFDQLAQVIREMLAINTSTLYPLLYTIDLDEMAIQRGAGEMSELELPDVIAHLILERELKKVLLREYFKNCG